MHPTFADIVLELLKGEEIPTLQKKYYLVVKNVVAKKVRMYFPIDDPNELETITEDITQDFFIWLIKENKKKKFTQYKERLTSGYLLRKISNLVIDHLRKVDTLNKYISKSLDETAFKEDDNKQLSEIDLIPAEKINLLDKVDWQATAWDFLNLLIKTFNEEQMKTLCHWIFRDKYSIDCFLEGLSSSAKYKRVERLKKLLKEVLSNNPLEKEEWKAFIELMELYCQKHFGRCVSE